MKRKLVAIVVILLLVGTFVFFQRFSQSAQAHWAASATPRPAKAPSTVLESPPQSRWTASATVSPFSSNSATPTHTSLPVK
jgi:curli biogenesis system outer membrane secretion channel CsgG